MSRVSFPVAGFDGPFIQILDDQKTRPVSAAQCCERLACGQVLLRPCVCPKGGIIIANGGTGEVARVFIEDSAGNTVFGRDLALRQAIVVHEQVATPGDYNVVVKVGRATETVPFTVASPPEELHADIVDVLSAVFGGAPRSGSVPDKSGGRYSPYGNSVRHGR